MRRELDAGIVPSSARRSTAHEPLLERQEEEDDDLERFDALGSASLRLSFSRSSLRDGSSTRRSSPRVLEGARRTSLCPSDQEEEDDLERFDAFTSASSQLELVQVDATRRVLDVEVVPSSAGRITPHEPLCSSDRRRRTTASSALTLSVLLLLSSSLSRSTL